MRLLLWEFKCSECGGVYESPGMPEWSYGEFLMRSPHEIAYLNALDDGPLAACCATRQSIALEVAMRRITQAAMISAMMFLAVGCGASGNDAPAEGHAGESAGLPEKEITIDLGDGITLEMVLIPAGEFLMGSSDAERKWLNTQADADTRRWAEREREKVRQGIDAQGPQHRVRITQPFYLGKYPVTQQQWVALMGRNPSQESIGRRKPVERVNGQEIFDSSHRSKVRWSERESQLTSRNMLLPGGHRPFNGKKLDKPSLFGQ